MPVVSNSTGTSSRSTLESVEKKLVMVEKASIGEMGGRGDVRDVRGCLVATDVKLLESSFSGTGNLYTSRRLAPALRVSLRSIHRKTGSRASQNNNKAGSWK